jgi:hypothetical protein
MADEKWKHNLAPGAEILHVWLLYFSSRSRKRDMQRQNKYSHGEQGDLSGKLTLIH